jgi:hypothetical protein
MIGFGHAKAADVFASGQFRQIFLALCFRTEFMNRQHHQR